MESGSRRVDVFFYGLFMDAAILRSQGVTPENPEQATVADFAIRIGQRATLVPSASGRVHGMLFSLTLAELDKLYSEPSVQTYKPHAVTARLADGHVVAALCYSLPGPQSSETNPEYAAKLRAVADKVGLPTEYIESLG
jgi:DNA-binding IclR family transcriptional regulator